MRQAANQSTSTMSNKPNITTITIDTNSIDVIESTTSYLTPQISAASDPEPAQFRSPSTSSPTPLTKGSASNNNKANHDKELNRIKLTTIIIDKKKKKYISTNIIMITIYIFKCLSLLQLMTSCLGTVSSLAPQNFNFGTGNNNNNNNNNFGNGNSASPSPRVITIGAVFDDNDPNLEMAFREAIDQVSLARGRTQTRIEAYVVNVKPGDSFHAGKIVCQMIARGVWAIFGPSTPSVSWLVRSIANNLHIPHIQFNWDYQRASSLSSTSRASSWAPRSVNMTLNLFPEANLLSRAFMDYIHHRNWKSFTIVYDDNEGIIKLKDLLRLPAVRASKLGSSDEITRMSVRQFQSNSTYKKLFKDMSKKFETNVILNVKLDRVTDILRQARSVGMMTEYHNYLITDLDFHTLDLTEFKDTNCNISGLVIVDAFGNNPAMSWTSLGSDGRYRSNNQRYQERQSDKNLERNMNEKFVLQNPNLNQNLRSKNIFQTTAPSLLFDAVSLFVRAVDDLDRTQVVYGPSVNCERNLNPWAFGSILINFMKMMSVPGLTGNIKFDTFGQRSDFVLDILEFKKSIGISGGFRKSGTWTPRDKIVITRNFTSDESDVKEALKNKTLRCSIPTNAEPYAMWKPDYLNRTGNDRIEGYCVDLLEELSIVLGFKFELVQAPNNAYGTIKNGEWNGMIRELLDRKVDIAIADLTITSARQSAVDFTLPFMNLGISILFKKPDEAPPDLFSFLKPFSVEVWIYMATAFLGVSLLLYIISRISPYEWVSGHPCDDDPDELENQFSLGKCLNCGHN